MILMDEVIKLEGEESKDKIEDAIIATAVQESSITESAMMGAVAESSVVGVAAESSVVGVAAESYNGRGIAMSAMGKSIASNSARGEKRYELIQGRRFAMSAVGNSEDGVKINVEVWDHTDNNNPVSLKEDLKETELKDAVNNKPVALQEVVKESKLKDAVGKKPVENFTIENVENDIAAGEARTVGDQTLHTIRVGDKTDTLEIEEEHCLEAVLMNTASAHTFDEGYITAEKQGEVAEHIDGSGGGHASIQVFRVGCLSVLRGGDQNRTKSVESFTTKAVENDYTAENIHPKKLQDAGKEGDDPVRLKDVQKENELQDAVNNKVGDQTTVYNKVGDQTTKINTKVGDRTTLENNNPVKENQLKDAVQMIPVELGDADKDINHPVRLKDALKENELKDAVNNTVGDHQNDVGTCNMKSAGWRSVHKTRSAAERFDEESTKVHYIKKYAEGNSVKTTNREGGHALKSLLPEVKGSALHGADVWGGHAQLLGARPGEVRDQGVGQPRHEDVGYIPTNDVHTVKKRAEEQAAMRNYYVKSTAGKQYKTTRNMELPRHRALITLRCPEDSMGGDIVEGPVVFSLKSTTRYGRSTR